MTRDHHHHQFYGHHHHQHQQHHQQQMMNQIQGFDEANHHYFGSNTNMGMMIDFSKQQQQHHHENLLMVNDDDHNHIQNQRQSQGLSLSLSSSNPTSINLQSFELRSQQQQQEEGYSGKSTQSQNLQHSHQVMMMMMMNNNHHQFQIGSSKYLSPTQELLSEFCSLGVKQSDEEVMKLKKFKNQKAKQQDEDEQSFDHHHHDNYASTSSKKHVPPLHSLEFMELQKRKSKLISMLEEVKRRYGHYREQMRGAVGAFETAVGIGAGEIYTALAARAMSRHFRCLKDGIISQIQETSQALGEKEDDNQDNNNRGVSIVPRGETPRLKLLDQALRQQKSFRQMSLVDAHPWRPQRGLPERAVTALRAWLFEHFLHPYPSDVDKHILARQTGLSRSQVSNWFINARVRLWKPMIEEMYCEETRIEQDHINHHHDHDHHHHDNNNKNDEVSISILNPMINNDSKPDPNQLIRIEPESLSSIVTNPTSKITHKNNLNQGAATTSFGSTFDFSLYGNHAVTYAGEREGGSTRGVSLTLGLQRNDGNGGVSLAFSPVTVGNQGGALFYGREHMEDCQQGSVQYAPSMLDGDQSQNLPYRNLMGAQLLHDIV